MDTVSLLYRLNELTMHILIIDPLDTILKAFLPQRLRVFWNAPLFVLTLAKDRPPAQFDAT